MKYTRKATPVVLATTLALTLAACAQSERTSGTDQTTGGDTKATFTFGAAGAPEVFDPFYASDGETFRVTRQMFEGLVGIKAGTADIEPELAEKWEPSQDGKSWTFSLRKGVKFTDGEAFNAAAVCYNFDRMFDQNEVAAAGPAEYWSGTMGGFKSDAANSLYKSCEAKDDSTAVINITHPTSKFPTALSLDSFSMQSPKALKAGDANNVTKQGEGFGYPAYSKSPVGTGPYKLEKYDEANKTVTLVRNDDYWGEKAKTAKIIFKIIPDESTPSPGAQGRQHRRLRPAEPGRLEGSEGRRQQRPRPPGVQHPVPGPQPGEEPQAQGPQGSPGALLRPEPRAARQDPAARGRHGRDAVHAGHGRWLQQEPPAVLVRPGEGQVAAQGGRRRGHDAHVRLPV